MQFKLFTATVAAMAVGSAIAGPVPAIDNHANAIKARAEQATNAVLEQSRAQFQQKIQDLNAQQTAAGKQVPTAEQLNQIKQQVTTSQATAHQNGKQWDWWGWDNLCYDDDWWVWWPQYYTCYANTWNTCGYSYGYCNSWYGW